MVISNEEIDHPAVEHPDILIALSQEAYTDYVNDLKEGGVLLVYPDMVPNQRRDVKAKIYDVPAVRIAEELGKKIVANVVTIGAFTALTDMLDVEVVKEAIKPKVPKGMAELNLNVFEKGYGYGKLLLRRAEYYPATAC